MDCKVRYFRGAVLVDIPMTGITLLAGKNEAGKSSVCEALGAALASSPIPFFRASNPDSPLLNKKDMPQLVNDGSQGKVGGVLLRGEQGQVQVSWPTCEVETTGTAPKASKIATGLVSLIDMDPPARARYLIGILKASPTKDDYIEALTSAGLVAGGGFDIYHDPVWAQIEIQGWDAVYKNFRDQNTKATGQWEAITGERYGENKANDYHPSGWVPELDGMSVEEHAAELANARQKVEDLVGKSAASDSELDQLERAAEDEEAAITAFNVAQKAVTDHEPILNRMRKTVDEAMTEQAFVCDHCGGVNLVRFDDTTGIPEITATEKTENEIAEAQEEIRKSKKARADAELKHRKLEIDAAEAGARAKRLAGGKERLHKARSREGNRDELNLARDFLASTERQHRALVMKLGADAAHQKKLELGMLLTVLEPGGIRQEKMVRQLDDFNQQLAKLSELAGFGQVAITEELDFHYRGLPYFLLSKSSKFRVSTIVQIACSLRDGSQAIVIDGVDILDQGGRNGLIGGLLPQINLPSVIAMTLSKKELAPDLEAHGLGATLWIENGVAARLVKKEN